ncbi:hypothetical protein PG993_012634 [Apiospora rasikravindrae]|uniref:Uncharacterized protein n=1 Tax=Apiospora rasikravindrae TaxID=990691 RepID=A0ABR1S366_9PEZI
MVAAGVASSPSPLSQANNSSQGGAASSLWMRDNSAAATSNPRQPPAAARSFTALPEIIWLADDDKSQDKQVAATRPKNPFLARPSVAMVPRQQPQYPDHYPPRATRSDCAAISATAKLYHPRSSMISLIVSRAWTGCRVPLSKLAVSSATSLSSVASTGGSEMRPPPSRAPPRAPARRGSRKKRAARRKAGAGAGGKTSRAAGRRRGRRGSGGRGPARQQTGTQVHPDKEVSPEIKSEYDENDRVPLRDIPLFNNAVAQPELLK